MSSSTALSNVKQQEDALQATRHEVGGTRWRLRRYPTRWHVLTTTLATSSMRRPIRDPLTSAMESRRSNIAQTAQVNDPRDGKSRRFMMQRRNQRATHGSRRVSIDLIAARTLQADRFGTMGTGSNSNVQLRRGCIVAAEAGRMQRFVLSNGMGQHGRMEDNSTESRWGLGTGWVAREHAKW
ncbi:hypothetical protein PENSPDRAFT_309811 [Peniophora sp. CONT]|nr:hypothetical protein PENSPDRAFT_309811 [Peniophora sp. CONT]